MRRRRARCSRKNNSVIGAFAIPSAPTRHILWKTPRPSTAGSARLARAGSPTPASWRRSRRGSPPRSRRPRRRRSPAGRAGSPSRPTPRGGCTPRPARPRRPPAARFAPRAFGGYHRRQGGRTDARQDHGTDPGSGGPGRAASARAGPRGPDRDLPHHGPVAPDRRQGDPAQAPEQDLLSDQRRRARGGPDRRRPPPAAGARLVLSLLPRPGSLPAARGHAARHVSRGGGFVGGPGVGRPSDAQPLGTRRAA